MNKNQLKELIKEDRKIYTLDSFLKNFIRQKNYKYMKIGKFVILARKAGYYQNNLDKVFLNKLLCFYYKWKKNRLGERLNIEFDVKEFGRRLKIYHGNIIVNQDAIIGDDCVLHGNNCIGNKGSAEDNTCPKIGNNVEIGVGTSIIGNIVIEDNIKISANSLVNKSCLESNFIYGGIPAKKIKNIL